MFLPLTENQMDDFNKNYYDPSIEHKQSRGEQVLDWITQQLRALHRWHLAEEYNEVHYDLKIARMDLVFDNSRMINLLLDRGQAIKHKNSAKIYQLEHLINLEKAESYHSRIVGVFITYETERDIRYAQRHKQAEIFKERNPPHQLI